MSTATRSGKSPSGVCSVLRFIETAKKTLPGPTWSRIPPVIQRVRNSTEITAWVSEANDHQNRSTEPHWQSAEPGLDDSILNGTCPFNCPVDPLSQRFRGRPSQAPPQIPQSPLHILDEHHRNRKNDGHEVVPGIEPGLPEETERVRIRSDNRYTTQPSGFLLWVERRSKSWDCQP